jgi:DNA helicase-2/ATP-dependent DNA helicase PcrA
LSVSQDVGAAAQGADDPLLADLNPEQRQAVQAPPGPLLVLAGAGSGKTRVLTRRLAYLIRGGAAPHRILAITFTNRAAREMLERTEQLLGASARGMWVHTFHAACARILRREIEVFGFSRAFTILDAEDQRAAVREVLREMGLSDKQFPPAGVQARISRCKQDLLGPGDMGREARDPWSRKLAEVYGRYQEKLRAANSLDFDDLIAFTVQLLEDAGDEDRGAAGDLPVGVRLRRMFDHVLVDEYQDTNRAQYRLVRALCCEHRSLTAVGDEDQSIYAFRGADVSNIQRFEEDFPQAVVVRLERNYRSTQAILDAAASVIGHNPRRYPKRLWTDQGGGERITVYRAYDPGDEAAFVATQIAELRPRVRGWGDFVVLYRTHAQSRALEEALLARGIPYAVVGGLKFYDRKEIRDTLAYLRLLVNPYDWASFRRAVAAPRRGVGDATLNALAEHMAASGESLPTALAHAADIPGVARAARTLEAFQDLLERLRAEAEGGVSPAGEGGATPAAGAPAEVAAIISAVLAASGMWAELKAEDSIESRARLENLDELVSVARQSGPVVGSGLAGLSLFLERAALISEADGVPEDGTQDAGAVLLMTLHAVKGLEYPVVFLVGMEEGVFPHARTLDNPPAIEEERRLCYVGMTRARQRLILTHALRRGFQGGPPQPSRPSRFLAELDPRLVTLRQSRGPLDEDVLWRRRPVPGLGAGRRRDPEAPAAASARQDAAAGGDALSDVAVGERVVHPRWGEGVVVSARGRGPDGEVTVDFAAAGRRTVVLRYARLQRGSG